MIELSGGLDSLSFLAKKVAAVEEVMFLVLAEEISVLLKFVFLFKVDGVTSNVLVREDIRQKLFFRDHPDKFLEYVRLIKQKCLKQYLLTNYIEDCANRVLT